MLMMGIWWVARVKGRGDVTMSCDVVMVTLMIGLGGRSDVNLPCIRCWRLNPVKSHGTIFPLNLNKNPSKSDYSPLNMSYTNPLYFLYIPIKSYKIPLHGIKSH